MSKDKMPAWMREANEAMRRDVLGEPRPTPAATPGDEGEYEYVPALPPHEQAFYLGAVWGHRQGREHDGPLNGAAIHDEYRRYFPANSQATQWSEAVARADEARAAEGATP